MSTTEGYQRQQEANIVIVILIGNNGWMSTLEDWQRQQQRSSLLSFWLRRCSHHRTLSATAANDEAWGNREISRSIETSWRAAAIKSTGGGFQCIPDWQQESARNAIAFARAKSSRISAFSVSRRAHIRLLLDICKLKNKDTVDVSIRWGEPKKQTEKFPDWLPLKTSARSGNWRGNLQALSFKEKAMPTLIHLSIQCTTQGEHSASSRIPTLWKECTSEQSKTHARTCIRADQSWKDCINFPISSRSQSACLGT